MDFNASFPWSTPLLEVKYPDHHRMKEALIRYCYEFERQSKTPIESGVTIKKKANLYESKFDFFNCPYPEVQALRNFCAKALAEGVLKLINHAEGGTAVTRVAVDLHESWIHITHEGGYHEIHNHPNCTWCGIYYLEPAECTVEPLNGVNRFFSPIDIMFDDPGTRAYPQKPFTLLPEEGKLFMFPSYVKHLAVPYRGKKDRILISFNSHVILPEGNSV